MHPSEAKPSRPEGTPNRFGTDMPPVELNADDVIDRMKGVIKVATDTELSRVLGTSNKNIASWRSRNSIPYEDVLRVSLHFGASMEYILTGRDEPHQNEILNTAPFDRDILRIILRDWITDHYEKFFDKGTTERDAEVLSATIICDYDRYINLMRQATVTGQMSRMDFIVALQKASSTQAIIESMLRTREATRHPE